MTANSNFTAKIASIFSLIKQSFSSENLDLTAIPIKKSVFLLAIPMMFEMAMESVFALVDLYFVGHLKESAYAIQTVGLTESLLTIVYSISIGISMAATAIIARRIGEKKPEKASESASQAILLSIIITIILSIFGFIYAKDLLIWMGSSLESAQYGERFTQIMMASCLSIVLLFLINGIFRGAGNAAIAMKSLWLANIINIILCPILIRGWGFFPEMGLEGAALATAIGRSCGVLYQLYCLTKSNSLIQIKLSYFKPKINLIINIVKIAVPAIVQYVIASCSWIILARIVAQTGGEIASSGYQTALRLMMFFMLPAWGLSNAAATLVGQNLGNKNPEKAEKSVLMTMKFNIIYMVIVSVIFYGMSNYLVSIFTTEEHIKIVAKEGMYILASGFVLYAIGMVMMNAFNGAGDTMTPTLINFVGFWLFQIPLAYFLSYHLNLKEEGVFIAIPIAETFIAIIAFILFKRGKWKLKQV
ncbi:putative efflux protein, MATE family [Algoriella xinjiangensis]|uniref:Multidrug-efflux transporter n=1 Tax=Algoriella xinjiangensis TaxID=684065 RepID=A0A1I4YPB7_9FLAO|nr:MULTISPECIES: MATE family efflux transporter [Algoriella]MBO6212468.1 MATE family efflux transporter [Algoriella sp.]SFN39827.1 putative efflux protein, MATE family [Algoriella xinjiangensis]VDH17467.1 Staphylococcal virulence regulator protein A [Algoriella xinjiangensis]